MHDGGHTIDAIHDAFMTVLLIGVEHIHRVVFIRDPFVMATLIDDLGSAAIFSTSDHFHINATSPWITYLVFVTDPLIV